MSKTLMLTGGSLAALLVGAGCSVGQVLLTTGAVGGNLELLQILAQAFGFTITPPV